jgi:hypothetical protein
MRIERVKNTIDVLGGNVPGSFEETRPKTVRTRAGIGVHAPESMGDLSPGERNVMVMEGSSGLRI